MQDVRKAEDEAIGLRDMGVATEMTRGDIYKWPWWENTPPPFDHVCPYCQDLV